MIQDDNGTLAGRRIVLEPPHRDTVENPKIPAEKRTDRLLRQDADDPLERHRIEAAEEGDQQQIE